MYPSPSLILWLMPLTLCCKLLLCIELCCQPIFLQNFFPHPYCQQEMLYENIINITPLCKHQTRFLLLSTYFWGDISASMPCMWLVMFLVLIWCLLQVWYNGSAAGSLHFEAGWEWKKSVYFGTWYKKTVIVSVDVF